MIFRKSTSGFSLVELLVAMSVFVVVISIVVGVFIQGLRSQRIVNNLIMINSNASLILEQMAREIRAGKDFELNLSSPGLCSGENQSDSISFLRKKPLATEYAPVKYALGTLREIVRYENGASSTLTSIPDVQIKNLCFFMDHDQVNPDPSPWRITISMRVGTLNSELVNRDVNIQTTVTSRRLPR